MAPRTEATYSMLMDQDSWQVWYDSIQNLASIYFIWEYYDPNANKEVRTTSTDLVKTGI